MTQGAYFILIKGDVQGVNYRYFAKKEAIKLGLTGWVKNEPDGTVSALIQGDTEKAQVFVDWAKGGSPMATVQEVAIQTAELDQTIRGFEVK
jgi:acylphosphatase